MRGGCGIDVKFTIHSRDRAGNHLIEGGLTWAIRAYPDNAGGVAVKLDVQIEDHKNGVYSCVFRPAFAGPHTVLPASHARAHTKKEPARDRWQTY